MFDTLQAYSNTETALVPLERLGDGSLAGTFRLPPLAGAVLLKALRAAAGDLEHLHPSDVGHGPAAQKPDVPAETSATGQPQTLTSSSLADALLVIAEAFLAEKVAAADDPEVSG